MIEITEEMREIARQVIAERWRSEGAEYSARLIETGKWDYTGEVIKAMEIVAAAYPLIAAQERERCAMIADARKPLYDLPGRNACSEIAGSIRAQQDND